MMPEISTAFLHERIAALCQLRASIGDGAARTPCATGATHPAQAIGTIQPPGYLIKGCVFRRAAQRRAISMALGARLRFPKYLLHGRGLCHACQREARHGELILPYLTLPFCTYVALLSVQTLMNHQVVRRSGSPSFNSGMSISSMLTYPAIKQSLRDLLASIIRDLLDRRHDVVYGCQVQITCSKALMLPCRSLSRTVIRALRLPKNP